MIYGYLRVSSDAQDVNSQKQGVDGFARAKGWTIEKYISDEGISGGVNPDKRKLGPMLKKLQKGDIVICSEISRLGRDLYMIMDVLHFCMKKEVIIYTVKDRFVLGDDIQSKVLAFAFGLSAEIERQMIRQRTLEGLRLRRKMGVLVGRPPGKQNSREHPKLGKYKDRIIEIYQEGTSMNQIGRIFGVDRGTVHRYLVKWGVWKVDPHHYNPKHAMTIEESREKSKQTKVRAREKYAAPIRERIAGVSIDTGKLRDYILADMTIPEIAAKFPDIPYDDVYDIIYWNEELNILYRLHAQKKLLKKRY